ncbi:uncharacterized protein [Hemitrygon akajei]|uniref:uncharacterized protein n=1 Tax=Hemitrygon akajei TaxID=2704970 RepID=UPI003BFA31E0
MIVSAGKSGRLRILRKEEPVTQHYWDRVVTEPGADVQEPVTQLLGHGGNRTWSRCTRFTSRWSFPEPGPGCKQDDDDQQSSVRIRMDTVRKLKRAAIGLKRILPGGSSREDDRDTGRKVPNQGQIESDVPMESGLAAEEEEQIQPRDSDVSDIDQDLGTSTNEATACQLGRSLNTELSSPQQGAESEFTISDLLAQGEEYRLYQLTKFYRDRLKQAIEEKVERLGIMLTEEGHFSREENESNDLSPSIFSSIINYLNCIIAVCFLKTIRCVIHNSSVNEGAQDCIQEVITILQHECQAVTIFIISSSCCSLKNFQQVC